MLLDRNMSWSFAIPCYVMCLNWVISTLSFGLNSLPNPDLFCLPVFSKSKEKGTAWYRRGQQTDKCWAAVVWWLL